MLVRALELEWDALSEEIGFWLPAEVHNEEHDDKPEGEEEPGTITHSLILHKCNLFITHEFLEFTEEILAGRPVPGVCNVELHTDYGGAAVRWGLTHHKESAADCCQACLDQAKRAKPGEMRCNIWVYCPSEFGCFSPDIYEHKHQECWLKYVRKVSSFTIVSLRLLLSLSRIIKLGSLNCRQRSQNGALKTDTQRLTEITTQKRLLSFLGFQVL